MKIAVVVQGRFHAFDLVRALTARGHDVTLFTNYPKWAVKRFGLTADKVRSFWLHGLFSKAASQSPLGRLWSEPERWLHPMFGRWAARQLSKEKWDVIHGWSGVSEETLKQERGKTLQLVMRGSAHIRAQGRILEEEEERTGLKLDRPGPWITAREEREYKLADRIVALSSFASKTFQAEGFGPPKLRTLPLGANTAMFRPKPEVIEARCRRIRSGAPLRILYVGAVIPRKGLLDIARIVRTLPGDQFEFRLIGPVSAEAKATITELSRFAELVSKQPHNELPRWYAWGDVFVFPTVEDGYAVVLAQAHASGLPILATTNCCAPDLIKEGETGWVLPIRSPQAFVERLLWCESHREELAQMVHGAYLNFQTRDWNDVAADFESLCVLDLTLKRHQMAVPNGR